MKTSAIVCAVLAGTFGFSTIASAQGWRDAGRHDRNDRVEQRQDRREARRDRREDRREARQDRRDDRRDDRREARRDDRRQDRAWHQGYRDGARQPHYVYSSPSYVYSSPSYRYVAPAHRARFQRGGYLPWQYRSHAYYVNDWHAYPRLYAPPYGQQWVNVDGEFLLVAIATGLIANALLN